MTSTRPRRRRPTPATLIFRAIGMASALVGLSCRVNSTIITRTGRRAAPAFLLPLHSLHSTQPFTTSSTSLHGRGGGGGKGDDKLSKGKKKGDLPEKTCVVCGRPFTWRAKWAKVWDEVKYCSDRCRGQRSKGGGGGGEEGGEGGGGGGGGKMKSRSTASSTTTTTTTIPRSFSIMATPRRTFLSTLSGVGGGMAAAVVGVTLVRSLEGRGGGGGGEGGINLLRPPSVRAEGEKARRPAKGEIDALLEASEEDLWPDVDPPYVKSDFARLDETDDGLFYDAPKLVEHIDKPAIQAMSKYYQDVLGEVAVGMYGEKEKGRALDILDVGASWVSHLPPSYTLYRSATSSSSSSNSSRVAGLGMNAEELRLNPQLTEFSVCDLNKTPRLPYDDASFDAVVCALTIDYLTRPISVCREITRVLRPKGRVSILFSNRLFFTKAVANWAGKDDVDHVLDVASYLHHAAGSGGGGGREGGRGGEGRLSKPKARDLSPSLTKGDPLYVVWATKL